MKKIIAVLLAVSMMSILLVGCSDDKKETADEVSEKNFSAIDLEKYVTKLGEYKGLALTTQATKEINDEAVDVYIKYMLENNRQEKEVTDRAVQKDDVVNINYVGKKDGEAFEGGTADNYDLQIGSGSFIEGFEDGLIGCSKGDVVDLNLTFPEDYHAEDLAGQDVVFTVTVNKISELIPAVLNEEFVANMGIDGVKTVDDFKAFVKENLTKAAEEAKKNDLQSQVMDKLLETSEFVENQPEELYNYYKGMLLDNFKQTAASAGMEFTDFIQNYYGMTEEQFNSEVEVAAKSSTNQAMALALIAQKEGIEVTDEELEKSIQENYANFGYESAEAYKETGLSEDYRDYLTTDKVLNFIIDNAVITEEQPTTEAETETVAEESAEVETETAEEEAE